jgi:aspartyl/asparaginyl beta-hydroxylase (cupin superfamily)
MAHFAQLDPSSIVIDVIVVDNINILDDHGIESEAVGIAFCQSLYGGTTQWRQTSYNASFRKNYAGIGYHYDPELDAFIAPQPYPSWHLNTDTCQWNAPKPYPTDGRAYRWDESLLHWVP